jgi:hypothetical protein
MRSKTEAPEQQTKAAVKNVLDVLLRNTTNLVGHMFAQLYMFEGSNSKYLLVDV